MSSPAYGAIVASQRPALYLPLDEASGSTAFDRSGNYRNSTYVGSPVQGLGPPLYDGSGAIALNGTTQWIDTTYNPWAAGQTRTLCCLGLRTSAAVMHVFGPTAAAGSGAGARVFCHATDPTDLVFQTKLATGGSFVTLCPSIAFTVGQWMHFALIHRAGTSVEVFLNGISQGAVVDAEAFDSTGAIQIGNYVSQGAGSDWVGRMAHFAIFERELTPAEILAQVKATTVLGQPLKAGA